MLDKIYLFFKSYFKPEVLSAIGWSFFGQISNRLVNLVSGVLMARLMLPDDYGVYVYMIGTLVFIGNLSSLSLRIANSRNIAFLKEKNNNSFKRYLTISILSSIVLGVVGSILGFFVVNFIVKNTLESIEIVVLYFCSIVVFSEVFFNSVLGLLTGLEEFKWVNIFTLISSVIKFFSVYFGFYLFGLNGAIFLWCMFSLMISIVSIPLILIKLKHFQYSILEFGISECYQELKLFLKISIPVSIESSLILISSWIIQTTILSNEIINGKAELAIFNVAFQWKSIAIYLPAILINLLQPFFSKLESSKNINAMNELLDKTKKVVIYISLSIYLTFLFLGKKIISFYGVGYEDSFSILLILISSTFFIGIANLYRQYFISKAKVWAVTFFNTIFSITMLIVFFILIPKFTMAISYSVAYVSSEVLLFVLYYVGFKRLNNE